MMSSVIHNLPSVPTNNSERQKQARNILDAIAFTPFEQCQPLSHDFSEIPDRPGIYAVRHKYQGLLYIGKTKSLRGRFKGGHKAFLWAWLDQYKSEDVRIAVQTIPYSKNPALLLELEAIILRATEPPYNVQIHTGVLTHASETFGANLVCGCGKYFKVLTRLDSECSNCSCY